MLACACWRLAGTAEPQLLKASSDGLAFLWFSYSKCSLHDNVCRNEVLIFVIFFQATFPLRSPAAGLQWTCGQCVWMPEYLKVCVCLHKTSAMSISQRFLRGCVHCCKCESSVQSLHHTVWSPTATPTPLTPSATPGGPSPLVFVSGFGWWTSKKSYKF